MVMVVVGVLFVAGDVRQSDRRSKREEAGSFVRRHRCRYHAPHHITSLPTERYPPPPLVSITVLFAVERQSRAGGGIL